MTPHSALAPMSADAAARIAQESTGCSDTTRELIRQLLARDAVGRAKYGTTLDRTDLTREQWLQHMVEELLDAAGYALAVARDDHTADQAPPE